MLDRAATTTALLVLACAVAHPAAMGQDGGVPAASVSEGKVCTPAVAAPVAARATFKAAVAISREHGCSQSSETTASLSDFTLVLDGNRARLTVETFDGSGFGPSLGAFRAGRREFAHDDTRWRRVYGGTVTRKGNDLVLHFTTLETSVDRRGGTSYGEVTTTAIDGTASCGTGGVGVAHPLIHKVTTERPQADVCAQVLLCRDLLDLGPIPASAREALAPIAQRVLVDGRLPLGAGAALEVRAKNLYGHPMTSFTGGGP
jgi:hypothetical protein